MIIHRNEMKTEIKDKMRGGDGSAHFTYLVDAEGETNTRLLAEITLEPGSSIGEHRHNNETEYYFILSGQGSVLEGGKEITVNKGDSVITGHGASHSIKNTGEVPLIFHAVIVTY
jgi:mannose-6-phosphate isomerase-like protein (cupin superfamily)